MSDVIIQEQPLYEILEGFVDTFDSSDCTLLSKILSLDVFDLTPEEIDLLHYSPINFVSLNIEKLERIDYNFSLPYQLTFAEYYNRAASIRKASYI